MFRPLRCWQWLLLHAIDVAALLAGLLVVRVHLLGPAPQPAGDSEHVSADQVLTVVGKAASG